MKNKFNLNFVEDCAIDVDTKEYYAKESIIEKIKSEINSSKTSVIKRYDNKEDEFVTYLFESDSIRIKIKISKELHQENKKYLSQLNKIYVEEQKKKKRKKGLTILGMITVVVAGITFSGTVSKAIDGAKEVIIDIVDNPIDDLEFEIELHSTGKYITFDDIVYEEYGHGCVLQDGSNIAEAIEIYCEEHEITDITEAAIEKYEHFCKGEEELARQIKLKKLHKENKKIAKNK